MLRVYVCDSLRGSWRLKYNLWGHLIISIADAKEISSALSLYRSVIHMQADKQTNMLSFASAWVCSLDLITGLWHHPWDGRQAVNHLVAMIWDEGDRDVKDKAVCPISRVRSLLQQKPMSESEAAFSDESRGKHPSHIHMSDTPNTPASISTESEEIPAKQHVKLRGCLTVLSFRQRVHIHTDKPLWVIRLRNNARIDRKDT